MSNREIPEPRRRDSIYRALEAGNLRAAEALLAKRDSLTWWEAAVCAPLAFHRPIRILRRILDLGPEGQIYCAGEFIRPGGGWSIRLCTTLLVAAAALDDLAAVEELLKRGYCQDSFSICREYYPGVVREWTDSMSEWYQEASAAGFYLDMVWMEPRGCRDRRTRSYPYELKKDCDPLGAAIWCGAVRCVERLLPEKAEELSLMARQALSGGPLPGDEARRQAVTDLVCRKYGQPLEELLDPGVFLNRASPLFLPCLERHPEWFTLPIVLQFIEWSKGVRDSTAGNWAWNALPLIPGHLMAAAVQSHLISHRSMGQMGGPLQGVFRHPCVRIAIDRCAVPGDIQREALLDILEHMEITGAAPEGGLSGLAASMLAAMLRCLRRKGDLDLRCRRQLVENPKAMAVLSVEDPAMISAYLDWKAEEEGEAYQDVCLLKTVLGIREECSYAL